MYRLYNDVKEIDKTKIVRTRIYKQSYRQFICFALFFVNGSNQHQIKNNKKQQQNRNLNIMYSYLPYKTILLA